MDLKISPHVGRLRSDSGFETLVQKVVTPTS